MHTIDLEPFMHGGTNITGIRMIDPDDEDIKHLMANWRNCSEDSENEDNCPYVLEDVSDLHVSTTIIFKGKQNLSKQTLFALKLYK